MIFTFSVHLEWRSYNSSKTIPKVFKISNLLRGFNLFDFLVWYCLMIVREKITWQKMSSRWCNALVSFDNDNTRNHLQKNISFFLFFFCSWKRTHTCTKRTRIGVVREQMYCFLNKFFTFSTGKQKINYLLHCYYATWRTWKSQGIRFLTEKSGKSQGISAFYPKFWKSQGIWEF